MQYAVAMQNTPQIHAQTQNSKGSRIRPLLQRADRTERQNLLASRQLPAGALFEEDMIVNSGAGRSEAKPDRAGRQSSPTLGGWAKSAYFRSTCTGFTSCVAVIQKR